MLRAGPVLRPRKDPTKSHQKDGCLRGVSRAYSWAPARFKIHAETGRALAFSVQYILGLWL